MAHCLRVGAPDGDIMPLAYVIQPIIEINGTRKPKSSILDDVGRDPKNGIDDEGSSIITQPTLQHSSNIGIENWCLSLIWGKNLKTAENDPEIIFITKKFNRREDAINNMEQSPNITERNDLNNILRSKGLNATGLSKYKDFVEKIGREPRLSSINFDPKKRIMKNTIIDRWL